jgi:hypothetical protein
MSEGEDVFDVLAQSVLEMSDEEVAAEYREDGEDLSAVASRVREVLLTAAEQQDLGFDSGAPDHERLRAYDADFTPGPVVAQGLEWVDRLVGAPDVFLDPSAGAGVFGQQYAALAPRSHRIGIEIREEEFPGVEAHYMSAHHSSFESWGAETDVRPDIIATNPPFTLFAEFVETSHEILAADGALMLLGLSTWGQSAAGAALFERFMPIVQLRIGGRIGFRGPGHNPKTGDPWGSDLRDYSWWIWMPSAITRHFYGDPYWRTIQLPSLSLAQRTWRVKPGTERADP